MKLRSSTKIAVGFVLLAAAVWFGYGYITNRMVMQIKFDRLQPGEVNLVGIDTGRGYRVQVSNRVAQLVEAKEAAFQGQDASAEEGPESGVDAKRVPVDDMIKAMQGDIPALSNFVAIMNDKAESDDWPTTRIVWSADKLRKALDGDKALSEQLVKDLNINLDGTPIPEVRRNSIYEGIIVDAPVPVHVAVGNTVKVLVARLQQPYRPRLAHEVEAQLKEKNVTPAMLEGYYSLEAKKVLDDPGRRENVRKTLESMIDPQTLARYAEAPERVLKSARVVVNEKFVKRAYITDVEGPHGQKLYNMNISLTDEGRMRLWQYSKLPGRPQLLLTVSGTPIAAPRVVHELAQSELTITQLPDESLARDAVSTINQQTGAK